MADKYTPLLIARQKDAKFCKDDYHLGWLYQDDAGYYWSVWGMTTTLKTALKIVMRDIKHIDERRVLITDTPIAQNIVVHEPLPEMKEWRM